MKKFLVLLIGTVALVSACQPVRETHQLSQPADTQLEAKPGDTVLTIVKEKNLPSEIIEGKADVLGRTSMTGLTTLQYRGVENNRAVFCQRVMRMESDATDLTPAIPRVQNGADQNIYVNLAQASPKVVVVEQRTLIISRADNQKLIYSIHESQFLQKPVAN